MNLEIEQEMTLLDRDRLERLRQIEQQTQRHLKKCKPRPKQKTINEEELEREEQDKELILDFPKEHCPDPACFSTNIKSANNGGSKFTKGQGHVFYKVCLDCGKPFKIRKFAPVLGDDEEVINGECFSATFYFKKDS